MCLTQSIQIFKPLTNCRTRFEITPHKRRSSYQAHRESHRELFPAEAIAPRRSGIERFGRQPSEQIESQLSEDSLRVFGRQPSGFRVLFGLGFCWEDSLRVLGKTAFGFWGRQPSGFRVLHFPLIDFLLSDFTCSTQSRYPSRPRRSHPRGC